MILLWFVLALALAADTTRVEASLVVKVAQPVASADTLVRVARDSGGWFAERTGDRLVLRVPTASVDAVIAAARAEGVVVARDLSRRDLGTELADVRARLAARQAVLDQYFALLPEADPEAVLTVEREILRVVQQVESLEGRLRVLEHDVANARVVVAFRFHDRRAPTPDGSSAFPWLNQVDLVTVMDAFAGGWVDSGPRLGMAAPAPDGFSTYRVRREHRSVSPDGVVYRVRAFRNRPPADLGFWSEALANRMEDAGYTALRSGPVDAATLGRGTFVELTAPLGADDAVYAVGVFVRGRRLVVVEAAGEVSRYEARRPDVVDAIRGL